MSTELDHHNLLFGVRRSVRYHSRRQQFYERCHQSVIFASLLLGSATIAIFAEAVSVGWPLWAKMAPAAIVTVLAALDLVIGTTQKSWKHADLYRQFIELERQLEAPDAHNDDVIANITQARLAIEATEPPVLRVLDMLCHNELSRSMGCDKSTYVKIGRWQRIFAPFFDIAEHSICD